MRPQARTPFPRTASHYPKLRLTFVPASATGAARQPRFEHREQDEQQDVMHAPSLHAPAPARKTRRAPVENRGWAGVECGSVAARPGARGPCRADELHGMLDLLLPTPAPLSRRTVA